MPYHQATNDMFILPPTCRMIPAVGKWTGQLDSVKPRDDQTLSNWTLRPKGGRKLVWKWARMGSSIIHNYSSSTSLIDMCDAAFHDFPCRETMKWIKLSQPMANHVGKATSCLPSPSHQHFHRCYVETIPSHGWFMTLFYPYYLELPSGKLTITMENHHVSWVNQICYFQ